MSKRLSGPKRILRGVLFLAGGVVVALPVLVFGLWEVTGLVSSIIHATNSNDVAYVIGYHTPVMVIFGAVGFLAYWMISTGIDYLRPPVYSPDGQPLDSKKAERIE